MVSVKYSLAVLDVFQATFYRRGTISGGSVSLLIPLREVRAHIARVVDPMTGVITIPRSDEAHDPLSPHALLAARLDYLVSANMEAK